MAEAVADKKKSAWKVLGLALRNRKTGFMLLFGFASGLPFALFLGTLFAWLTEAEVDLETMGIFSLIGLAYAFQFLWSPLIDKVNIPLLHRLGRLSQSALDIRSQGDVAQGTSKLMRQHQVDARSGPRSGRRPTRSWRTWGPP